MTAPLPVRPGTADQLAPVAQSLRAAADGFRSGGITWGTGWFYEPAAGTRCTLGGLAWAIDPADEDCDPKFSGPVAKVAMQALADYLITVLDAVPALEYSVDSENSVIRVIDAIETVGGWNDQPGRTVEDVIAALEAVAERAGQPQAVPA